MHEEHKFLAKIMWEAFADVKNSHGPYQFSVITEEGRVGWYRAAKVAFKYFGTVEDSDAMMDAEMGL